MPPFSIAYGSGVRRAEAIALGVADLDFANGQLRVGQGNGKKPPGAADTLRPSLSWRTGSKSAVGSPAPSSAPYSRPYLL
jgi:integrase